MQSFNPKMLYHRIWFRNSTFKHMWLPVYVFENPFYPRNDINWIDVAWLELGKKHRELLMNSEPVRGNELNQNYWRLMPALEAILYEEQVEYVKQVYAAKQRDLRDSCFDEPEEEEEEDE